MADLQHVDWQRIPRPVDDGAADHLVGMTFPSINLPVSSGGKVNMGSLLGVTVIFVYPMTGKPDESLPEGWDTIPGARGCTPQACAYRDHASDLSKSGVSHIYGLSAQSRTEQFEAAERLDLPYPLLSDSELAFAQNLNLPTFTADGRQLLKRLTLIAKDAKIEHVIYPVFPPDSDPIAVVEWLANKLRRDL